MSRPASATAYGLLPYYPLESGLLTGKYRRGEDPPADSRFVGNATVWPAERWLTDEAFDAVEALEAFADERGVLAARLAIGGLAAMPTVGSVIAGATTPAQVQANARAGGVAALRRRPRGAERARLARRLTTPH